MTFDQLDDDTLYKSTIIELTLTGKEWKRILDTVSIGQASQYKFKEVSSEQNTEVIS
jgi:hypothetical protein